MASVSIRNVRKSFGTVDVIRGISMEIVDGEFVVMVGPSGCGKSTLLRMVAGLESITSGEIAIAGRVVNNVEPKDRDIAMVFQNYALYPHKSVYDNMAYGLKIRGVPKAEIDVLVRRAAETLELTALLKRGSVLEQLGRRAEARQVYSALVRLAPGWAPARERLQGLDAISAAA